MDTRLLVKGRKKTCLEASVGHGQGIKKLLHAWLLVIPISQFQLACLFYQKFLSKSSFSRISLVLSSNLKSFLSCWCIQTMIIQFPLAITELLDSILFLLDSFFFAILFFVFLLSNMFIFYLLLLLLFLIFH